MPKRFDFISPGVVLREIDQSQIETPVQDDGILIIGRATSGPAMKPIRVTTLEDFTSIFGKPISGKGTINSDVYRDGNFQGPTYGMYAAQAWLAAGISPVTFVRLLGEDSDNQGGSYTKAGWNLGGGSLNAAAGSVTTAYGLWVMPSGSNVAGISASLGAILYSKGGALTLNGTIAGSSDTTSSIGQFIKSVSTSGQPSAFKIDVHSANGTIDETKTFHFTPTSKDGYIRNVLNANPQKLDSTNYGSGQTKKYFVGETFEESVKRMVNDVSGTAGQQYGMLIPIVSGSTHWVNHQKAATAAKSGWIINRNPSPKTDFASFHGDSSAEKLFRIVSLHEGSWMMNNHYITFEDLKLGTPKNPNSSFTLRLRNLGGDIVEEYTRLNLDESSENFVAKRIGDMYQTWNSTHLRYDTFGDYKNISDYIRIEMDDNWKAGLNDTYALPWGFFGPCKPKSFTYLSSLGGLSRAAPNDGRVYNMGVLSSGSVDTFGHSWLKGNSGIIGGEWLGPTSNMISSSNELGGNATSFGMTASFHWPSLKLTEENTARSSANYKKSDFFGLRHKFADTKDTRIYDQRDYIDLLRALGGGLDIDDPGLSSERQFVFSLDEVRINRGTGLYYWQSGSHLSGLSETALSGSEQILDDGIKKFSVPLFGGFDGLDIEAVEPFSHNNVLTGKDESSHYAYYSMSKAIDTISDKEIVNYDIVSIPGLINEALTNKVIDAASDRGDALAIIDLDDGYKESFENNGSKTGGTVASVRSNAESRDYNNSYAATYYPRVRMRDTLGGTGDVFVAPASVAGIGAIASSEANSDGPWFAPAGFNRGGIKVLGGDAGPRVVGTWKHLTKDNRDVLYERNINPIARFPAVGEIVIFGQKTLQQDKSALDRINVRRLLIYLKKRIGRIADTILFDQNIQATWSRFDAAADLVLRDVQQRFGIVEYKLVLDETTTTPDLVDQNILYAKIFVKPARAIEFIAIDFIVTKSGIEF
jgi:hypothetical protein